MLATQEKPGNRPKQQVKLVIFDLDQTLVDLIKIHDRVTGKLFKEFFNVKARLTDIDFTGRSITGNFCELARFKQGT